MQKYMSPMYIARFLYLLIAAAAILSMAINTRDIGMFIRFFSISSNMLIAFCMIYLCIFLPEFKDANKKKLVTWLLFWIFLYLVAWNALPLFFWIYSVWLLTAVSKTQLSPLVFVLENSIQILIIPYILYAMLRYETKSVFKEKSGKRHMLIHLLIICGTVAGVSYLVIAAMK